MAENHFFSVKCPLKGAISAFLMTSEPTIVYTHLSKITSCFDGFIFAPIRYTEDFDTKAQQSFILRHRSSPELKLFF